MFSDLRKSSSVSGVFCSLIYILIFKSALHEKLHVAQNLCVGDFEIGLKSYLS